MKVIRSLPAMMWLSFGAAVLAVTLAFAPGTASIVAAGPVSDVCTDVPDSGPNFDFTSACQKHDACYGAFGGGTLTAPKEILRSVCDQSFLQNMKAWCTTAFQLNQISFVGYLSCNSRAMIYYDGVRAFGKYFFYNPR